MQKKIETQRSFFEMNLFHVNLIIADNVEIYLKIIIGVPTAHFDTNDGIHSELKNVRSLNETCVLIG